MTFQSIAQIKPKLKNQRNLHIKLRLSKVVEYFEGTTSNCFTRSSRKVGNKTSFGKIAIIKVPSWWWVRTSRLNKISRVLGKLL